MRIKITPDVYFIISVGMALFFHSISPITELISYPCSLLGIVLIVAGILLVFVTNSILLKKRTSIKVFESPKVLVTSGSFKFSRNPIYLGMTVALVGVAVLLGSLSPFILPILFAIIINCSFIPQEERALEKLFGEKYRTYQTEVRRWF